MSETNISNSSYGDMANTITNYTVATMQTDGVSGQKETEWQNTNWGQQLGYYKKLPELRAAVDALAT